MSSRRDAVAAYAYTVRRLRSGMLHGEPDSVDPTSGRTWRGVIGGIVLALVVGAAIAIYGFISPGGNDDWKKPGTLVVTKDSGARYLYLGNALHPVLNQTSAKLLVGSKLAVQAVASESLRGTPQGAPLGIAGAPDSVPAPGDLDTGTWLACAVNRTGDTGTASSRLVVRVGTAGTDTRAALTTKQAVLVADPDGTQYLVWGGRRLRVDSSGGALAALGYAGATPVAVPTGFVDALPAGVDLRAPVPDGVGQAVSVSGFTRRVGQLFRDGSGQGYVVSTTGLQPVTTLQLALLRGNPQVQQLAYQGGVPIVNTVASSAVPRDTTPRDAGALPSSRPKLVAVPPDASLCGATQGSSSGTLVSSVRLVTSKDVVAGAQTVPTQPGVRASCEAAAAVIAVRPGAGALVTTRTASGAGSGVFLVGDTGVKYPVPAAGLKQLGYSAGAAEALPSGLLRLLPTGPSLNPVTLSDRGLVTATSESSCG